jgi:hypothetical protein
MEIMKHLVIVLLSIASIVASTPGFAQGAFGRPGAGGGMSGEAILRRDPGLTAGPLVPPIPEYQSRIPAPLPPPAQPPVINGPLSQPPGM